MAAAEAEKKHGAETDQEREDGEEYERQCDVNDALRMNWEERKKSPKAAKLWFMTHSKGGSSEGIMLSVLEVVEEVDKKAESAEATSQKALAAAGKALTLAQNAVDISEEAEESADAAGEAADDLEGRVGELELEKLSTKPKERAPTTWRGAWASLRAPGPSGAA